MEVKQAVEALFEKKAFAEKSNTLEKAGVYPDWADGVRTSAAAYYEKIGLTKEAEDNKPAAKSSVLPGALLGLGAGALGGGLLGLSRHKKKKMRAISDAALFGLLGSALGAGGGALYDRSSESAEELKRKAEENILPSARPANSSIARDTATIARDVSRDTNIINNFFRARLAPTAALGSALFGGAATIGEGVEGFNRGQANMKYMFRPDFQKNLQAFWPALKNALPATSAIPNNPNTEANFNKGIKEFVSYMESPSSGFRKFITDPKQMKKLVEDPRTALGGSPLSEFFESMDQTQRQSFVKSLSEVGSGEREGLVKSYLKAPSPKINAGSLLRLPQTVGEYVAYGGRAPTHKQRLVDSKATQPSSSHVSEPLITRLTRNAGSKAGLIGLTLAGTTAVNPSLVDASPDQERMRQLHNLLNIYKGRTEAELASGEITPEKAKEQGSFLQNILEQNPKQDWYGLYTKPLSRDKLEAIVGDIQRATTKGGFPLFDE
jgi:hypothetical protein